MRNKEVPKWQKVVKDHGWDKCGYAKCFFFCIMAYYLPTKVTPKPIFSAAPLKIQLL